MARFANSVMFTPASAGTVDFVVSAAVQGFMTPALAGAPTGVYKYRAESNDLSQWEIGEGTYTSGTTTLTRTTVLYNSAGTGTAAGQSGAGTKISFTVAPNVGIVQAVQDTLEIENAGSFTTAQQAQARSNIGAGLAPTVLSSVLASDVVVSTSVYTDIVSVAQGTTGTFLVFASLQISSGGASIPFYKIWDGTTVIDSGALNMVAGAGIRADVSLMGVITNPAGNIKLSVTEVNASAPTVKSNSSGNNKDTQIIVVRIA